MHKLIKLVVAIYPQRFIKSKLIVFLMLMLVYMCVPSTSALADGIPNDLEYVAIYDAEMPEPVDMRFDAEQEAEENMPCSEYKPDEDILSWESESAIPIVSDPNPFTPSGTGTVVDNAIDSDGKEFYTISSNDGDIFYLIIDRQRSSQNVYFLNAVTEMDLLALAEQHGRDITSSVSMVAPIDQLSIVELEQDETPGPEALPKQSNNKGLIIFLSIAIVGVGGAAYYFKIIKGKKNPEEDDIDDDFDDEDDDGGEDDYDYGDKLDDNEDCVDD